MFAAYYSTRIVMETKTKSKVLSFRVASHIPDTLRVLSKFRGTTDVATLLDTLSPFADLTDSKKLGQIQRLRKVIETMMTIAPVVGDGFFQDSSYKPFSWNGIDVKISNDGGRFSLWHTVKIYEGQTKADAVTRYVQDLWKALAWVHHDDPDGWSRDFEELCEPNLYTYRHLFHPGYVGMEKWRTFRGVAQLEMWQSWFDSPKRKEPSTVPEWSVYGWCMEHLGKMYDGQESQWSGECDGSVVLYRYPTMTLGDNIRYWARQVVADVSSDSDPESLVDRLSRFHWTFVDLNLIEDGDGKKSRGKYLRK